VLAATVMRAGLALTFLIYAVYKMTSGDEYRIVVAEAPLISHVAALIGAQTTVNLVAVAELLLAFPMLPGISSWWGALFQACALSTFLLTLGYPFSFPQDLGLLGVIGGLLSVQALRLPLVIRRAPAGVRLSLLGVWSGRLGLDGRRLELPPDGHVRSRRRQWLLSAAGRCGPSQMLHAILGRLRSSVQQLSADHANCPGHRHRSRAVELERSAAGRTARGQRPSRHGHRHPPPTPHRSNAASPVEARARRLT
jgi:hypothetical protein